MFHWPLLAHRRPSSSSSLALSSYTTMRKLCLLLFFPALASGDGCPPYRLLNENLRAGFLGNALVPRPVKDFVRSQGNETVFGVSDCHQEKGDYEIGFTAACVDDGTCMCTALYNFNECQACELACGADIQNLDKNSFTANCSNLKTDISETCSVDCNYITYDCFEGDPSVPLSTTSGQANSPSTSSADFLPSRFRAFVLTLGALFFFSYV